MRDNYKIQFTNAQKAFLQRDLDAVIAKNHLQADDNYLYTSLFSQKLRISRSTGSVEVWSGGWQDGNVFGRVMTVLDLLCDSKPGKHAAGTMVSMPTFGLQFHSGLAQLTNSPTAQQMQADIPGLRRRCEALGGIAVSGGDVAYEIPVFQDLKLKFSLWLEDEEFPAQLCWFWDANALQYLHYETMYYALELLLSLLGIKD